MVVLTQLILDEVRAAIVPLLSFLTVGTGDDAITLASTDIETPVQIGVADRNKALDTDESTDNFIVLKFKLTAAEPDTQPVNLSEVGIQDGVTETSNLKAGFIFSASTKDSDSQWTVRFSGRVIEGA